MKKGYSSIFLIIVLATAIIIVIGLFFLGQNKPTYTPQTNNPPDGGATSIPQSTKTPTSNNLSGTAKGVVLVESPRPKQAIKSPLLVKGFIYSKKGKLTISLKQKESGLTVTQPKVVQISGQSDKIEFAEAIQFGLPAKPQSGILEISFKDESGKGADDKVTIEVEFPSDLGSGL